MNRGVLLGAVLALTWERGEGTAGVHPSVTTLRYRSIAGCWFDRRPSWLLLRLADSGPPPAGRGVVRYDSLLRGRRVHPARTLREPGTEQAGHKRAWAARVW